MTVACILSAVPAHAAEATYIVNRSQSDSARPCRAGGGTCTLRGAIIAANEHAGRDRIVFAVPSSELSPRGEATFQYIPSDGESNVEASLPIITDPIVIDGTTQPGYAGRPKIRLLGSIDLGNGVTTALSAWGLNVRTDDSLIKGLEIEGFLIEIDLGGNRNVLQQSAIGSSGDASFGGGAGVTWGRGVVVRGSLNTVGTTPTGPTNTGNVIVESDPALEVVGSDTRIAGNRIGTDWTGMTAKPNRGGILVGGSPRTRILNNVISGNETAISFGAATDSVVTGNKIGLDVNAVRAIPNGTGIHVTDGDSVEDPATPTRILIGGTQAATRNYIAGNRRNVVLEGVAENRIMGNVIGLNARNEAPAGQEVGVLVGERARNNAIGVPVAGGGNTISGHSGGIGATGIGVLLLGERNSVAGNRIGTDASGTSARPNLHVGIDIFGAGNTVGGTDFLARNIISGNSDNGINVRGTSTTVHGNFIGVDWSGDRALPNHDGIVLHGSGNLIGGSIDAARNVISGNSVIGVVVEGTASGNTIRANYVGTNIDGSQAVGNGDRGIYITGPSNVIARNVISGNGAAGIDLVASGNRVEGNVVGLVADATRALGNRNGIRIFAAGNVLGGGPGRGNVISGNREEGVLITGDDASGNQVIGNYIGTNGAGRAAVPNRWGISLMDAPSTRIGDCGNANVVSGNTEAGIRLIGAATVGTTICGNGVGVQADGASPLPNGGDGLFIDGALRSRIGTANVIAFNRGTGIRMFSGAGNRIVGNAIYDNGLLGIDLGNAGVNSNDDGDGDGGANLLQNYPRIVRATSGSDGKIAVSGTIRTNPNSAFEIHVYSSPTCDPSQFGEGRTYLGLVTVTTDPMGRANWNTIVAGISGGYMTATATSAAGNTSEFSACLRAL